MTLLKKSLRGCLRRAIIEVATPRGGDSSRWRLIEVATPRGGDSSRWRLLEVATHRGGDSTLSYLTHSYLTLSYLNLGFMDIFTLADFRYYSVVTYHISDYTSDSTSLLLPGRLTMMYRLQTLGQNGTDPLIFPSLTAMTIRNWL